MRKKKKKKGKENSTEPQKPNVQPRGLKQQ